MELAFVVVIGIGIGTIVRYSVPGRGTHGLLLLPAVGATVATVVWVALVWLGLPFDGGWIWVASLGAAALGCVLAALLLPARRHAADAELFAKLT